MWKCVCDCGNTIEIAGKRLKTKNCPKSCGCATKEMAVRTRHERYHDPKESTLKGQYGTHVSGAKANGFIPLSREIWEDIVTQRCHYCGEIDLRGISLSRAANHCYIKFTPEMLQAYIIPVNGVDRVDSTRGYEPENCVSACRMCNVMKNGYPQHDFFQRIKRIYECHGLHAAPLKPIGYADNFMRKAEHG